VFELFFRNSLILDRHRRAPFALERERYLEHRLKEGHPYSTVYGDAIELFWAVQWLKILPGKPLTLPEVHVTADRWARHRCRIGQAQTLEGPRSRFLWAVVPWLRFLGWLKEPPAPSFPFSDRVEDFVAWMTHERGFSLQTTDRRYRHLRQFMQWYGHRGRALKDITPIDIDQYLAACKDRSCGRASIAAITQALRTFFRYAATCGWCEASLSQSILSPRIFSHENLPMGPSWQEVQRLIASMDTDRPNDIRDRACTMLLAIYGLRAGEVAALRLQDMDWEHDQLRVIRPKQRKVQTYPLIPIVGNGILRYIQTVRPRCSRPEVFLTQLAPFRPIDQAVLHQGIAKRWKVLGIQPPRRGPHALRHACATHLIAQGFSLKEIGDHLGHLKSASTQIYAKVDLIGLRQVAAFDLGGLR
jgi:integrase/recombinase XerD